MTLKTLLRRLTARVLKQMTGSVVERWHNVELPEVRRLQPDMLGETAEGGLVHIELQSSNDSDMALRMMEYAIAIFRRFRKWPEQVVLYVGLDPLRMPEGSRGFTWRMVDVRELDGEPLLESERLEDNVIAILLRQSDERKALWRILERCRDAEPEARAEALTALAVLVRLRNLGPI